MREVISRYSRRNCRALIKSLAPSITFFALMASAVFYFGPNIIVEWPSRTITLLFCFLLSIWVIVDAGPFLLSIVLASLWEDDHVWIEGGSLHIGIPFTRRVELQNICAVEVGYAPGDIFGRMLTISTKQGRHLSFITDVSTEDWEQIKERIEAATQRAANH